MEKVFLTAEEMGLADYLAKPSIASPVSSDQYNALSVGSMPIPPASQSDYSCMCDKLKEQAAATQASLPLGTNELINRIVNKLYELAKDIELTSQGY